MLYPFTFLQNNTLKLKAKNKVLEAEVSSYVCLKYLHFILHFSVVKTLETSIKTGLVGTDLSVCKLSTKNLIYLQGVISFVVQS